MFVGVTDKICIAVAVAMAAFFRKLLSKNDKSLYFDIINVGNRVEVDIVHPAHLDKIKTNTKKEYIMDNSLNYFYKLQMPLKLSNLTKNILIETKRYKRWFSPISQFRYGMYLFKYQISN